MTDNLLETDIPEKFKDSETGEVNLAAMAQSYRELEKKLSQGGAAPNVPASPDEYELDLSHGLFDPDPEVNERLHKCGFSSDQAQEVYNLAAEKLVPMVQQIAEEFKADRELEKLINHYGGKEQWQEVSRQLLAFGSKAMPEDVLDNMASSYDGVLALEKMMRSEEPGIKQGEEQPSGMDESDLQSMMRDPRYWKSKDPAFVAKVTEGFKTLYGQG